MEYFKLNNGERMPAIGFGVYQIPKEAAVQAVLDALEIGYRKIDTAQSYRNEEEVGEALARSGLRRGEVYVTTKVWIEFYGYDSAKESVMRSLDRLRTDYADLVLLHQPFGDYYGAYRALIDLQREGLVRSVGVSNFYPDRLSDIAAFGGEVPQVNQIEINPFFTQKEAVDNMRREGVLAESWGPFREGKDGIFTDPTLTDIARRHGRSVAQVILRWLYQLGISSNCKSVRRERMKENFSVFDFALTEEDMARVAALDTGRSLFLDHRTPEAVALFKSFIESRRGKV